MRCVKPYADTVGTIFFGLEGKDFMRPSERPDYFLSQMNIEDAE